MAKNKKGKRSDYISYLLLRVFLFALKIAPRRLSRRFCVGLGKLVHKYDKKHRKLTIENLSRSFPEKSAEEIEEITRHAFENLGATVFDFVTLLKINAKNYKDYFEFEGVEHIREAQREKKGIIFVSAHICCWEMMSVHCFEVGETSVLAKDLHNKHSNRFIKWVRSKNGVTVLPVRNSVGRVMKLLREGRSVHTLMDQYSHKHEGILVDFFGRKASTGYFISLLARKLDIAVIPTFVTRVGGFRYKLCYREPVKLTKTDDREKDIYDNTQAITRVIEDEIRTRPEDWTWMHNRWKSV